MRSPAREMAIIPQDAALRSFGRLEPVGPGLRRAGMAQHTAFCYQLFIRAECGRLCCLSAGRQAKMQLYQGYWVTISTGRDADIR